MAFPLSSWIPGVPLSRVPSHVRTSLRWIRTHPMASFYLNHVFKIPPSPRMATLWCIGLLGLQHRNLRGFIFQCITLISSWIQICITDIYTLSCIYLCSSFDAWSLCLYFLTSIQVTVCGPSQLQTCFSGCSKAGMLVIKSVRLHLCMHAFCLLVWSIGLLDREVLSESLFPPLSAPWLCPPTICYTITSDEQ